MISLFVVAFIPVSNASDECVGNEGSVSTLMNAAKFLTIKS